MNRITLKTSKGIALSLDTIAGDFATEVEFNLSNMEIGTKENVFKICKYLNNLAHENKLSTSEWLCVSTYPSALLVMSTDVQGNKKYLEITREV